MKNVFFLFTLALLTLACTQDQVSTSDIVSEEIKVTSRTTETLDDIFDLEGYVLLEDSESAMFDRQEQVVAHEGKLYVLDNATDLHTIKVFDLHSGKYEGNIGKQFDQFEEVSGITITSTGQLAVMDRYHKSIFLYTLKGDLLRTIPLDVFGEDIVEKNGNYYVYNEFNDNDVAGGNILFVYDSKGNLLFKNKGYNDHVPNSCFGYTGFLTKTEGDAVLLSTPFSKSVVSVGADADYSPYLTLQFGEENSSDYMGLNPDTHLNECLLEIGNFICASINFEQRKEIYLYDRTTKNSMVLRNANSEVLPSELLFREPIQINENTIAVPVYPETVAYYQEQGGLSLAGLKEVAPQMVLAIESLPQKKNPILIFLRTKPGASIR